MRGNDLRYPVVQDNAYGTWQAWRNQYWPAKYLIDARGRVRYWHFGEGGEAETEAAIRVAARRGGPPAGGRARPGSRGRAGGAPASPRPRPTWAGCARATSPIPARCCSAPGASAPARCALDPDEFAFRGEWELERERAVAGRRAAVEADVGARRVFLVLSSPGRPRRARVLVDGRPVPDALAGPDVRDGVAVIRRQRLYRLLDFGRVERHRIAIELEPGLAGYAFTFG